MTDSPIPQADGSPSAPSRNDDYFKQLGYFATVFSLVESRLFLCLMLMAGVSLEVGRAIFSGTRVKDAISFIGRICSVKEFPDHLLKIMNPCFEQINIINTVRNHIMHYGVDFREKQLVSSNAIRALLPEKEVAFDLSPTALHNMSLDLLQINTALEYCTSSLLGKPRDVAPLEATRAEKRAWLYKSPEQASRDRTSPRNAPKPKRQPQSSPE